MIRFPFSREQICRCTSRRHRQSWTCWLSKLREVRACRISKRSGGTVCGSPVGASRRGWAARSGGTHTNPDNGCLARYRLRYEATLFVFLDYPGLEASNWFSDTTFAPLCFPILRRGRRGAAGT